MGKTLFLVLGVLVVLLAYNVRADDVGCCCIGASQYAFRIQSYCTANFPGSTFIPDFTQGAWYLDVQEDYGDIGCTVLCSSNTCGNNSLDLGEQCDSSALPTSWNRNCTSLFGFTSGELGCSPYCSYDVSNCTTTSCGTAGCVGTPPAYCDGFNIIQNCTACPDCPFGFMCDPVSDTCAVTSEGCVNYNITYWYQDASGNPIQNCSACCLTGCNASNSPFCDNLPPPPPPPPTCTAGVYSYDPGDQRCNATTNTVQTCTYRNPTYANWTNDPPCATNCVDHPGRTASCSPPTINCTDANLTVRNESYQYCASPARSNTCTNNVGVGQWVEASCPSCSAVSGVVSCSPPPVVQCTYLSTQVDVGFTYCSSSTTLMTCQNIAGGTFTPTTCTGGCTGTPGMGTATCNPSCSACTDGSFRCPSSTTGELCVNNAALGCTIWQWNLTCGSGTICAAATGSCALNEDRFIGMIRSAGSPPLPLNGTDVTITSASSSQVVSSVLGLYTSGTLTPFQNYTLTASKYGYADNSTTSILDEALKQVNFSLSALPLRTIDGTVRNQSGGVLPGIELTIVLSAITSATGQYVLGAYDGEAVITAVDPTAAYVAQSKNINIVGDMTVDFNLTEARCFWYSKQPAFVQVRAVPGRAQANISWIDYCGAYRFDIFRAETTGSCVNAEYALIADHLSNTTRQYTDNISAGQAYCYKIGSYFNVVDGILHVGNAALLSAMDEPCVQGAGTYCDAEPHQINYCSANNTVSGEPPYLVPGSTGQDFVCMPNSTGESILVHNSTCTACGGLYNEFSHPLNVSTVLDYMIDTRPQNWTCSDIFICYFDATLTTIDAYGSCLSVDSCYDYASRASCEANTCHASATALPAGCEWINSSSFAPLGKGVCRPIAAAQQDCARCEESGCSPLTCRDYGRCYWDNTAFSEFYGGTPGCIHQRDAYCEMFSSLTDCMNSSSEYSRGGAAQLNVTAHLGPLNQLNRSDDYFNLGVCDWRNIGSYGYACVKNADGNNDSDCLGAGLHIDCMKDVLAPVTNITTPSRVSPGNVRFVFNVTDVHGTTTWFCIARTNDLSACTANTNTYVQKHALYDALLDTGDYTLFWYSEDNVSNKEAVNRMNFTVDADMHMTAQFYRTSREIILPNGSSEWQTDLAVNLWTDERVLCNASLRDDAGTPMPADLVLENQDGMNWTQHFAMLGDGHYTYVWNCSDTVGNWHHGVTDLRLVGNNSIELPLIWPKYARNANIPLSVQTFQNGTCRYSSSNVPFTAMTSFAARTHNGLQYIHNSTISLTETSAVISYVVKCNLTDGTAYRIVGDDGRYMIVFAIDMIPPTTTSVVATGDILDLFNYNVWQQIVPSRTVFRLACQDPEISSALWQHAEFGCDEIFFCKSYGCQPQATGYKLKDYLANDVLPVQYITFSSNDNGGNDEPVVVGRNKNELLHFDNLAPTVLLQLAPSTPVYERQDMLITPQRNVNIIASATDPLYRGYASRIDLSMTNLSIVARLAVDDFDFGTILTFRANALTGENYSVYYQNSAHVLRIRKGATLLPQTATCTLITGDLLTVTAKGSNITVATSSCSLSVTDGQFSRGIIVVENPVTEYVLFDMTMPETLVSGMQHFTFGGLSYTVSPLVLTETLTSGTNTLVFTVVDNAGNTDTETKTLVYDDRGPDISISVLNAAGQNITVSGSAEQGTNITVIFSVNDTQWTAIESEVNISIWHNGTLVENRTLTPLPQKTYTASFSLVNASGPLDLGQYDIIVNATDYFGTQRGRSQHFTVWDTHPPTFTVSINTADVAGGLPALKRSTNYTVTVTSSENLTTAPDLHFNFTKDGQLEQVFVWLEQQTPTTFVGNISTFSPLLRGLNNITATFGIAGTDAGNNIGTSITSGRQFVLVTKGKNAPRIFIPDNILHFSNGLMHVYGYAAEAGSPPYYEADITILGLLINGSITPDIFYYGGYHVWRNYSTVSLPVLTTEQTVTVETNAYTPVRGSTTIYLEYSSCAGITSTGNYAEFVGYPRVNQTFYPVVSIDCTNPVEPILTLGVGLEATIRTPGVTVVIHNTSAPQGWFTFSFDISNITSAEGTYTFVAVAEDDEGYMGDAYDSRTFVYDHHPPSIALEYPSGSMMSATSVYRLNFSVVDTSSSIDPYSIALVMNETVGNSTIVTTLHCGETQAARTMYCNSLNPYSTRYAIFIDMSSNPLDDGYYVLFMNASDIAGNTANLSRSFEISVRYPHTPLLNISDGIDPFNSTTARDTILYTHSVTPLLDVYFPDEPENISIDELTINGVNVNVSYLDETHRWFFLTNVSLNEGNNTLHIRARKTNGTDITGNPTYGLMGQWDFVLVLDQQLPDLFVRDVVTNVCDPVCTALLHGNFTEDNPYVLNIRGEVDPLTVSAPDNPFAYPINFTGNLTAVSITVSLLDKAGNQRTTTVTGTYDVQPPNISITSVLAAPPGRIVYDEATSVYRTTFFDNLPGNITVTGVVPDTDADIVNITQHNPYRALDVLSLANHVFTYTLPLMGYLGWGSERIYAYRLTALDLAGNAAGSNLTIIYDRKAPAIVVSDPSIRPDDYRLRFRYNPPQFTLATNESASCNLTYVPQGTTTSFTEAFALTGSTTHQHTPSFPLQATGLVMFTCTDLLGNAQQISRDFIYDATGPSIDDWGITATSFDVIEETENVRAYYFYGPVNFTQLRLHLLDENGQPDTYTTCRYDETTTVFANMTHDFEPGNFSDRQSPPIFVGDSLTLHVSCTDFVGNPLRVGDQFYLNHYTYVLHHRLSPQLILQLLVDGKQGGYINKLEPVLSVIAGQHTTACRYRLYQWNEAWQPVRGDIELLEDNNVFFGVLSLENDRRYNVSVECAGPGPDETSNIVFVTDNVTSLVINSPADGETFIEPLVAVSGVGEADSRLNISVLAQLRLQLQVSQYILGAFNTSVLLLAPGLNIIDATLEDRAGNLAQDVVAVTYAPDGPLVDILVGLNGIVPSMRDELYAQALHNITIAFQNTPPDFVTTYTTVSLTDALGNPVSFTRANGDDSILLTVAQPPEGEYVLRIIARDSLGRAGSARQVMIHINPNVPAITLLSPSTWYAANATVRFAGFVIPSALQVFVEIRNASGGLATYPLPLAFDNSTFTGTLANALHEGRNDYTVYARSEEGFGTLSDSIYLQTQPPQIRNVTIG